VHKQLISSLLTFFVCVTSARAQVDTAIIPIKPIDADNIGNRDLIDVFHHVFNNHEHPHAFTPVQKTGRYHASVVPAAGYTLQTGFAGVITGNMGFYTSDTATASLSTVLINVGYTQYNQVLVPIQTNIWTRNNKYNLLGDWRYYKYPQSTYGLGSLTTTDEANLVDYSYVRFYQTVLRSIGHNMFVGGGYMLDYHWNITEQGNADGTVSDFDKYGFTHTSVSSGLSLNFLYDDRKNSINPEKGLYVNTSLRNNFTFLGSDNNWESLLIDIRKYIQLSRSSGNVLALWSYSSFGISGSAPYLDLPSNGWDTYNNTGRGYIQGRFRGRDMVYLEGEYRFTITRNHLLGGVIFANAESFSEWPSHAFQQVLPGYGAGIRVQVNKHSRTNIALDYGWGIHGSGGVFVNLGEVF